MEIIFGGLEICILRRCLECTDIWLELYMVPTSLQLKVSLHQCQICNKTDMVSSSVSYHASKEGIFKETPDRD